jgi:glutathione-independent formaldehyde dehydrogenase
MKAVVYRGPHEVAVEQVEDPRIEAPTDVLVRITSTAICGSGLHMYEGRTGPLPGRAGRVPAGAVRGLQLRAAATR